MGKRGTLAYCPKSSPVVWLTWASPEKAIPSLGSIAMAISMISRPVISRPKARAVAQLTAAISALEDAMPLPCGISDSKRIPKGSVFCPICASVRRIASCAFAPSPCTPVKRSETVATAYILMGAVTRNGVPSRTPSTSSPQDAGAFAIISIISPKRSDVLMQVKRQQGQVFR